MANLKNFRTSTLIAVITISTLITFIISTAILVTFFNRDMKLKELISQIEKSYRISTLHKEIKFERAFNLISPEAKLGLFEKDCTPYYVNDLLFNKTLCLRRDKNLFWNDVNIADRNFILGIKEEYTIHGLIKDNLRILKIITLTFFVFVISISYLGKKVFITLPSKAIGNELIDFLSGKEFSKEPFPETSNLIFSDIYRGINKLVAEVSNFKEQSAKIEISKQVVHDLRSPIALLQDQLKTNHPLDNEIAKLSINRIQQISDSLLKIESLNEPISVDKLMKEIAFVAKSYELVFSHQSTDLSPLIIRSRLSEQELYRILTNLIKNSKEAHANNIYIDILASDENIKFVVKDDGAGFSDETMKKVSNSTFSSKKDGNGLGLSYLRKTIYKIDGEVSFETSTSGATVSFWFPLSLNSRSVERIILLDDDKYVAINWRLKSENLGIIFFHFRDVTSLRESLNMLNKSDFFFIDLNIGTEYGLDVVKDLHNKGFNNIFIASGEELSKSELPTYVKDSVGKQFPF